MDYRKVKQQKHHEYLGRIAESALEIIQARGEITIEDLASELGYSVSTTDRAMVHIRYEALTVMNKGKKSFVDARKVER